MSYTSKILKMVDDLKNEYSNKIKKSYSSDEKIILIKEYNDKYNLIVNKTARDLIRQENNMVLQTTNCKTNNIVSNKIIKKRK